jgi:hypothetical protein
MPTFTSHPFAIKKMDCAAWLLEAFRCLSFPQLVNVRPSAPSK